MKARLLHVLGIHGAACEPRWCRVAAQRQLSDDLWALYLAQRTEGEQ